ncbi:MAG: trypsin-like serine protease [Rhodospirillales bacterium]|nr:trypsin-like serine protease [Rhodospirillales bacterium]
MTLPIRVLAFVAALLMLATGVHAQSADDKYKYKPNSVFGAGDVRVKADSRVYPWTAVGRFNKAGRGHCTATVVAPRIIVTSAHCVANRYTGGLMPPEDLHFVAGWDRGEYIFHSVASEIHTAPGYDPNRKATVSAVVYDWALIVLEKDPSPVTGIVRPAPYTEKIFWDLRNKKTVFTQAGYSGDRGQVLTADPDCKMWGFTKGLLVAEHGCQAVPGDSGSPIIFSDGKEYRLAAVHAAHTKNRVGGKGFAVPTVSFMKALDELSKKLGTN